MAREGVNVLLAGESWIVEFTEIKGGDFFTQHDYGEGAEWMLKALQDDGMRVDHMPSHLALRHFPTSLDGLQRYDCLILSDIGTNTLLWHPDTTQRSRRTPNRLSLIERYVDAGGGLIMIGGYMSFQGIDGKARYHGTAVERALPVHVLDGDDRVEMPEGFEPRPAGDHPILRDIPHEWPFMLFYNRTTLKEGASLVLEHDGEPILAAWEYGAGRSVAFTPDCAPHGAPPEFLNWEYFQPWFSQMVRWACRRD